MTSTIAPEIKKLFDENKRQPAKVESVFYGKEDHGILTCYLRMSNGSWSQSFGGLAFDADTGPAFVRDLCTFFRVADIRDVKGRNCFVLRSFGYNNDRIEGLEVDGRRFTLTAWRKKYYPNIPDRLTEELSDMRRDIRSREHVLERLREDFQSRADLFTDWDAEP